MSNINFFYSKTYFTILIALLFYVNVCSCDQNEKEPEIEISLGKIKGCLMKTRLGKTIYAFRGIKYAKAPIGERRFKPAEPVDPWTGIYDASQEGPACPAPDGKNVSEDCLILNIYTKKLITKTDITTEKLPVVVYFHTGGFQSSSSQSFNLGPQYLLDKDMVLVTSNYRLGSLGFMNTGDKYAPGNLGLKDQVLTLRFVKEHISTFGGDPDSVTISGQSAGSRSIFLHLVSPMSKGLFHRAIGVSGAPPSAEPLPHHQKDIVVKLAKILDCPSENTEKMFECFNSKPAKDFGDSISKLKEWHSDPLLIWYPVVEPEIQGLERFLPAQPVNLLRSGVLNEVPVMAGLTRDEFAYRNVETFEAAQNGDNSTLVELNEKWYELAPVILQYQRDTERSKEISKKLYEYYFKHEPITLKNFKKWDELTSDSIANFPVYRMSTLVAEASHQPVYFYEFAYEGKYSFAYKENGKPYGITHSDDEIYLFHHSEFPMFKEGDPECEIVEKLTSMWECFAKTGYPIPKDNDLLKGVTWEPMKPNDKAYLEIGEKCVMKRDFLADRMRFWEELFSFKCFDECKL